MEINRSKWKLMEAAKGKKKRKIGKCMEINKNGWKQKEIFGSVGPKIFFSDYPVGIFQFQALTYILCRFKYRRKRKSTILFMYFTIIFEKI